ncbi:NADH dehydrogenase [ubiquinone] 1 alpha subcomplex assembly factor 3 [Armadillidium vulgare]|nr:NADH dehydrogenase [ubiquinone] 1 alpha subcomplex assembly factor 3 [Armadillidium vulgare]
MRWINKVILVGIKMIENYILPWIIRVASAGNISLQITATVHWGKENSNSKSKFSATDNHKGFRLNNNFSVIGSMIIFPRTVLSWRVKEAEEVNVESLSLFTILEPKLDVIIIGKGDKENMISLKTIQQMRSKGSSLEILPRTSLLHVHFFSEGRLLLLLYYLLKVLKILSRWTRY